MKRVLFGVALALLAVGSSSVPERAAHERTLKTRVFLVYDEGAGAVVRRTYSVWDLEPEKDRTFEWAPTRSNATSSELVTGEGVLTWRKSGASAGDASAIDSVYRGQMKSGLAEGQGELRVRNGVHYEGRWRNGAFEGSGSLRFRDGTGYDGEFLAGLYEGEGVLADPSRGTYEGTFSGGQRHGAGVMRPIGGPTFEAVWHYGGEVPGTRRFKLAQGPGTPATPVLRSTALQIGAAIDFFTDESLYGPYVHPARMGYNLSYALRADASSFVVYPDDKQLMLEWKGGGLITECRNWYGHMQVRPVPLTFKLANRSTSNLKITAAALEVDDSSVDMQPFVVRDCTTDFDQDRLIPFHPLLHFANFGWGNPLRAKAELRFADKSGDNSIPYEKAIGDLNEHRIVIDLTNDLQSLGVNVKQFKAWSDAIAAYRPRDTMCAGIGETKNFDADVVKLADDQCLTHLKQVGVLGRLAHVAYMERGYVYVRLDGELVFDWLDAKGAKHAYAAPFENAIRLGSRNEVGGAEGARPTDLNPKGPILVALELGRSNYALNLPFAQVLVPGQTADVKLAVRTGKSSQSRFRLVVKTESGETFTSKNVELQTFIANIPLTRFRPSERPNR